MLSALRSILLIDDNEPQRYALARRLRGIGHQVAEAADGRSGLQLAQQAPSVILLDVNLPDMSGFDVCRQLKQNTRTETIPVILISATCAPAEAYDVGVSLGAASFLVQPVDPDHLQAVIAGALARNGTP